jgi:hypothetical protein
MRKFVRAVAALGAGSAFIVGGSTAASAAPFSGGNVAVCRVGSGTGSLINTGNPVFIDEFTSAGALVQSIAMPTTVTAVAPNKALIASGTASSECGLTRSTDGKFLIVTGYGAPIPTTGLAGSTAATVNRVIGVIDAAGNVNTTTSLTDYASTNNPRSAVSTNGTDLWMAGGAGGVRYTTVGSTTSVDLTSTAASGTFTNVRQVNIFGGQLYASSGSGTNTFRGVETIGTGLPTSGAQTVTRLPGLTDATNPSTYSYFLADLSAAVAGVDTLYVADDGAGALQKFSLVSGSWVSNGIIGVTADAYRGLTATVSGTSVNLFATRKGGSAAAGGGELVTLTDPSGYNAPLTGTPSLLASAAANTAFRGLALAPFVAPDPVVPESPLTILLPLSFAAIGVWFYHRRNNAIVALAPIDVS